MSKESWELLSWQDAVPHISEVNNDLAETIKNISPPDDCGFVKVRYEYSQLILENGKVHIPYGDKLYPLGSKELPNYVNDELGYTDIPMGLPLNKLLELYLRQGQYDIPFSIYNPGNIFSLWSGLQFGVSAPHKRFKKGWSIAAGNRSLYLLSKISDTRSYNRLKKEFSLDSKKPENLLEQRDVFEKISKYQYRDRWYVDVLFFSKGWFSEKNEKALESFKLFLYRQGWASTTFLRDSISFKFDVSSILAEQNSKPNPYIIDTIDHLYAIGYGYHPGFSAADSQAAPLDFFNEVLLEIYGLENVPIFFGAQYFDINGEVPSYYSLYLPTLVDFSPRSRKASKVVDLVELHNTIKQISSYCDLKKGEYEAVDYWSKMTQYSFFHTHQLDKYSMLQPTSEMPNYDSKLRSCLSKYPYLSFGESSSFLRGCVRIDPKS
ncbi:hypothetical protein LO80_04835 [Candidatus Francisella endociliophora]|uniref:Uncharacterized protein n=1 Tax=Candidatus Francisella endociliophora TaxID=653937 RepID=A0A097EP69_9GAMM|nr:hypothetical protein [Francisella sp. FSC1006]AIT09359.1 hypothetical protein LO80_04835 [Francisella sp. FSC1006]